MTMQWSTSRPDLAVRVGDTVTWQWDSLQNVVEANEDFNILKGATPHWRSGDVKIKGTYSITFQEAGTFHFISENTSKLRITIDVEVPAGIDRSGFFGLRNVPVTGVCQTCQISYGSPSSNYYCANYMGMYKGFDSSPARYNDPQLFNKKQFMVFDRASHSMVLDNTRSSCCLETEVEVQIESVKINDYRTYTTAICFG